MNQIRLRVNNAGSSTNINSRSMFHPTPTINDNKTSDKFEQLNKSYIEFNKFEECIYGDDWSSTSSDNDEKKNENNFG